MKKYEARQRQCEKGGPMSPPAFPTPYPGEFLGGVLLRYHQRYGGRSLRATLGRFKLGIGAIDGIPTGAAHFASCLAELWPGGLETIISEHTIWSFYRPFIAPEHARRVFQRISLGGGDALQFALGDSRSGMALRRCIRSCALCVQEDASIFGEYMLHVEHQLPGVAVCWKHEVPLLEWRRSDWIRPPTFVDEVRARSGATNRSDGESRLARLAAELWQAKLQPLEPSRVRDAYRERFQSLDLLTSGRRIRYSRVIDLIAQRFGDIVRHRLGASDETLDRWIYRLMYGVKASHHPIKHLLIIGAVFGEVAAFTEALGQAELSFWARLPTAPGRNNLLKVRKALEGSTRSMTAVAAELGLSTTTCVTYAQRLNFPVKLNSRRITPDLRARIMRMASRGDEINQIVLGSGASVATVYRVIRANSQVEHKRREIRFARTRHIQRELWLRAKGEHPDASVSQLRMWVPSVYAWLYRNDRKWLMPHRAAPQR